LNFEKQPFRAKKRGFIKTNPSAKHGILEFACANGKSNKRVLKQNSKSKLSGDFCSKKDRVKKT